MEAPMRHILVSGDNRGSVRDSGNVVLRLAGQDGNAFNMELFGLYERFRLESLRVVATELDRQSGVLRHQKHLISYPHEWPPTLFKEAVLFHLYLLLQMHKYGLTLKDALPENILFDGIIPVFVDFYSIVPEAALRGEQWLSAAAGSDDLRLRALQLMFVPHMLIPFFCYALGQYAHGKYLLQECFCNNCEGAVPGWRDLSSFFSRPPKHWLKKILRPDYAALCHHIRVLEELCTKEDIPWGERIHAMSLHVEALDVTPPLSGYVSYYADKGEEFGIGDPDAWNEKQRNVYDIFARTRPKSVIDVGANTGWYSQLAVSMGAKVVALDADASSIDSIYRTQRFAANNAITPLWMTFGELRQEGFSLNPGGERNAYPLHMEAVKRLRSDCTLCLGLLHHLTLGLGKSLHNVMETLSLLTSDTLVLEFVGLDDPVIGESPEFFPRLAYWTDAGYSLEALQQAGEPFFNRCSILESTPKGSRWLLVFRKD